MQKRSPKKRDISLPEATSRLITHIIKMNQYQIMELLDLIEKKAFKEKRKSLRLVHNGEVIYVIKGRVYTGFTKNFSTSGIFINTLDMADIGEKIVLSFELPAGGPLRVSGSVVRGEERGFAVSFDRSIGDTLST